MSSTAGAKEKETVLVIGSTGHIGVAAVLGALGAGRNVLAIVRNAQSAEKMHKHVGTKEGITVVEADISKDDGVEGVVKQVEKGELPSFQHVYACAGGAYPGTPLKDLTPSEMRELMHIDFELDFLAYRATIPYLLAQGYLSSTFSLCTGASGSTGLRAGPGITQGALFSLSTAAARELEETNVRFVEVYLAPRVEVDEAAVAAPYPAIKASVFASVYKTILGGAYELRGTRVIVEEPKDIENLRFEKKF